MAVWPKNIEIIYYLLDPRTTATYVEIIIVRGHDWGGPQITGKQQ